MCVMQYWSRTVNLPSNRSLKWDARTIVRPLAKTLASQNSLSEIHFFMADGDTEQFISFLIETFSAEFVPETMKSAPPFPRYGALKQLMRKIINENCSRFFVLSPSWERYPLVYSELNTVKDGRHYHYYYISQRYGGPAFDFILARTYSEEGTTWVVPGYFSDYPYYIKDKSFLSDYSKYETFDRPVEMKQAYQDVQKFIRKHACRSVCQETGKPGPWIFPDALKQFKNGVWLRSLGDYHFMPKTRRTDNKTLKRDAAKNRCTSKLDH